MWQILGMMLGGGAVPREAARAPANNGCLPVLFELRMEFQRDHCEGIDATWSVNADLVVNFRFQHKVSVRRYSLDLKDRYIPKALDEIEIVLLELREAKTSCL